MDIQPLSTDCTITHPLGLHLRVGKDLVTVANQFRASITAQNLSRPSPVVDAKSILQLMQLQARQGHTVRLSAEGPDAHEALMALCRLFDPDALAASGFPTLDEPPGL
jgi:phosphotransferase system HPr (HPr) family protein